MNAAPLDIGCVACPVAESVQQHTDIETRRRAILAACFMLAENRLRGTTGKAMNHKQIEKDIEHLEHVICRISAADGIPLSYWRGRIDSVSLIAIVPSQVRRVQKLSDTLHALEVRHKR